MKLHKMIYNSTLIYSIYFTKNSSFNNLFWRKLLYSYHYSTKIHGPPTYNLYLINYPLIDLNSSDNQLILYSFSKIKRGYASNCHHVHKKEGLCFITFRGHCYSMLIFIIRGREAHEFINHIFIYNEKQVRIKI